ncbi:hypothetical protein [Pseudosporangium ferrugineum]|uniref:Uncharacterized protein n=1 Tax=Pseudosporangium ferrugineum TaxID=439699 RepID=A0A2T0RI43_9ACTN|nr:hypothetical protein [Pseudosporangium ferrugineum]PRY20828.1 hypothetical protein CLV70_12267 [Pseudosporangium ferrugineum]
MRWFRGGAGKRQVDHDPDRRQALLDEVRERFGVHVPQRFPEQARAVAELLTGDDGLAVAATILQQYADAAYADLVSQVRPGYPLDRRNYRPLWSAAGSQLRWQLFALPGGFHPYVQVAGAVAAVGGQARRIVRVTDPRPLLSHLFEVLDLLLDGWEFARVRVDTDAASLAVTLITAARDLNAELDDPPPLPPPVRELMRRNRTIDVYATTDNRIAGTFNPGKTMREALLA